MKKLLIFVLALSPLFANAEENAPTATDETTQSQPASPLFSNYCGSFSDTGCWGRPVGSFCPRYGGRQGWGTCYPSGFRDARGEYRCQCY